MKALQDSVQTFEKKVINILQDSLKPYLKPSKTHQDSVKTS